MVETLQQHHSDIPLIVTTATPTGGDVASKQLPAGVEHLFLPIDWPGAVTRFLKRTNPRCTLIMETELWPNLYASLDQDKIPLLIINGRLSAKTLKAPQWLRRLYSGCLKSCRTILARSEQDRTGFIALGAAPEQVSVIGNIKFSSTLIDSEIQPLALGRDYVLAASTRDEEEAMVVEAWQSEKRGENLLVVAPRHPARLNEILHQLRPVTSNIAVRSRGDNVTRETTVYIADTLGELATMMAGAKLVFMGGSLVEKGGHNLLEPAALGKPVITGPYMDNFADETRLLLEREAIIQVDDKEGLATAFTTLLADSEQQKKLGQEARNVINEHQDMAERYLTAIEESCGL